LRARIRLGRDAAPAPSELEITTAGFPDYALRSLARSVGPLAGTRPIPFELLQPVNGYFAMTRQRFTPAAALDRDFAWHGEGGWTGLVVPVDGKVLVRCPFLLPADWPQALHERTTPLYLNRGYPLTLVQEFAFALPEPAGPIRLPEPVESRRGPLGWRLEWGLEGSRLEARLEIVLVHGELDRNETASFVEALQRLYEALGQGALGEL